MPRIFEYRHTVLDDEIDGQGHVNNLNYIKWMLHAAVEHSGQQGWPSARYLEQNMGWVARTHFIEYLRPAFAGEDVVVKTWISNFKKVTSLRKYKIIREADNQVLTVAETNWAFVGLKRRMARRIPAEVAESFEVVPVDDEP